MRAKKFAKPVARRAALAATLARFVGEPRLDRLRDLPLLRFAARKGVQAPDPVSRYGCRRRNQASRGARRQRPAGA